MSTYNTIVLKGDLRRWHGENTANDGSIKPGYLVQLATDGSGKLVAHNTRGGRAARWFAKEDPFRGGNIQGQLPPQGGIGSATTYYSTGDLVFYHKAQSGDQVYAVLAAGENVAKGDWGISYGNGQVCKAASQYLANNTAASSNVTNTTTETAFSNGSVTIPKNTLQVGDVIRIRGQAVASATNSTDTLTVKVKIGSTVIATTGAVDVANGDVATFDVTLTVRAIGASGSIVAQGTISLGTPGTVTAKPFTLGATALDTTVDEVITITATWSVANAGDVVALQSLMVEHVAGTTTGLASTAGDVIGQFREALDLSASVNPGFVPLEVAA